MRHDALLIGTAILVGVGLTAAATYGLLHWLFGDLLP